MSVELRFIFADPARYQTSNASTTQVSQYSYNHQYMQAGLSDCCKAYFQSNSLLSSTTSSSNSLCLFFIRTAMTAISTTTART